MILELTRIMFDDRGPSQCFGLDLFLQVQDEVRPIRGRLGGLPQPRTQLSQRLHSWWVGGGEGRLPSVRKRPQGSFCWKDENVVFAIGQVFREALDPGLKGCL